MQLSDNTLWYLKGRILFVLFVSLTFFISGACEGEKTHFSDKYYSSGIVPKKTERISFSIDEATRAFTLNIRHFETKDGQEYLLHHNELNNSIGIYDIKASRKVRHVYYETEGPNGVGYVRGFDLINPDSVFLLDSYGYKLSMVKISEDSDTVQVYDAFKMRDFNKGLEMTPVASIGQPIVSRNDSIVLAAVPYKYLGNHTMYKDGINMAMIDMNSYLYSYYNLHTPVYDDRWTHLYSNISYTFEPEEELLVISLPLDDSIITIDKYGNRKSYLVKSALAKKPRPFRGNRKNEVQVRTHYLTQPNYGYIMYDKYREYYYRFTENVRPNAIQRYGTDILVKNIGVMVLDKNFQVLGETEYLNIGPLPIYFIGKKGLYRLSGSEDESKMEFELYEFPKN